MENSGEARVGSFKIGPSTALGRAIAMRVLLCKSLSELRKALEIVVVYYWSVVKRYAVKPLMRWMNPSKPSVVLTVVAIMALWLRRRGPAVRSQARLAYRRKYWRNLMRSAVTYDEWSHAAKMLDLLTPRRNEAELYDEDLVRNKLRELIHRRQEGGVRDIIFCLRADLVRNLGNMCNPRLHQGRLQVPKLIKDYIDEVSTQLRLVCDWNSEELSLEEKLAFMHETRHAFGRTALLLSGGASLGAFHVGVVKTLVENRVLPRVVAGASVGSIMCSVVATRTWPELQSFFEDSIEHMQFFDQLGGILTIVRRVLTLGAVHDIRQLQRMLRRLTSNMTFQEAYDMTGRVLGVSVCSPRRHEPPRLLNYLTSPHVVIWSAVTASCAFPGLFQAQELMAKDRNGELIPYHTPFQVGPEESSLGTRQWRDGSLESDLPMMQLKELFNVNHFVVSQANPHIAPLLRLKEFVRQYGGDFAAKLAHLTEMEVKHRCNQILELGFPMGGIAKLFAQDWEGDVTIVMPATLAQFAKIIQNPSPTEVLKAVHQGRRCTWEKLSAIKANCGIELVLDECVSFLNQMRRIKRNAERTASQGVSNGTRFNASKRIPSWNCMERESSWGSLDEETLTSELASRVGGPWGGPSRRSLRFSHNAHDGSDSESENNADVCTSWTRMGGPLMRTASANKFIQSLEIDMDLNKQQTLREEFQNLENFDNKFQNNSSLCSPASRDLACNDSDTEYNYSSSSDSRTWSGRVPSVTTRLEVSDGDLLQPEKSPVGIVFNVVKRRDLNMISRDYNLENGQEPELIDNECSHPGSPVKGSDNDEPPNDMESAHYDAEPESNDHDKTDAMERNTNFENFITSVERPSEDVLNIDG